MRHIITLSDGSVITSGVGTKNAIISTAFSASVNTGAELAPGSMCATFFEVNIVAPGGEIKVQEGTEILVEEESDSGERIRVGLFTAQKPTRVSANQYRVESYDRMTWLDRDISAFIENLTDWPYSLYNLAEMVLSECGLELKTTSIPNGDYQVRKFSAQGTTARTLMQKIGEACCRFGRIDSDGKFEFAWYKNTDTILYARDIMRNSLSYEDYSVKKVECVNIRQTEDDIGVSFPTVETEGANTYAIVGNFLLTADTENDLRPIAEKIYEEIEWISYTPSKFSVWRSFAVNAGDIITVSDRNGKHFTTCAMEINKTGTAQELRSYGSHMRPSAAVVNSQTIGSALFGKILELRKTIEGLRVAAKDLESQFATELEMVANGLNLVVSQVNGLSTYYRFDADGQYIGRPNDEITLRLAAGVIDILVAGYAAATFDRTGMTAPQATVEALSIGDYSLDVSKDGYLNLS